MTTVQTQASLRELEKIYFLSNPVTYRRLLTKSRLQQTRETKERQITKYQSD